MLLYRNKPRAAKRWLLVLSVAAGALTVPSVQAQADLRSERVRTDDLDLTTPAGRDKVDSRIRAAARRVCAPASFSFSFRHSVSAPYGSCMKKAIADAAAARMRVIERAIAARPEPGFSVALIRVTVRPSAPLQVGSPVRIPDAAGAE
jgi:UrcA family protein